MKVLLISHYFPPYNHVGAVRTGKMAKYLTAFGHDVRVITARNQVTQDRSLPVEIAADKIVYSAWIDWAWRIDLGLSRLLGGNSAVTPSACLPLGAAKGRRGWRRAAAAVRDALRSVAYFPDAELGWLPFALGAARKLTCDWKPDVVYASGGPPTTLLAGHLIARRLGVPWVAELRDLWTDNAEYQYPRWRRKCERRLEQRVLRTAAALVTVSESLATKLREHYPQSVNVVYNGFDPEDLPNAGLPRTGKPLRIAYVGAIHEGKQDPSPLFAAMAALDKGSVMVDFYGTSDRVVMMYASTAGVLESVRVHSPVPYAESLRLQRESDVLLFLSWTEESETGFFTGKYFEYLASGRPVLAVGPTRNDPARLLQERGAGVALADGVAIKRQLVRWIAAKAAAGIPGTPAEAARGYTRAEQARKLEDVLLWSGRSGPLRDRGNTEFAGAHRSSDDC